MSEIVIELKKLIGARLILYTDKNFRYDCRLLSVGDDGFIKFSDLRKLQTRFIKLSEIKEFEVLND